MPVAPDAFILPYSNPGKGLPTQEFFIKLIYTSLFIYNLMYLSREIITGGINFESGAIAGKEKRRLTAIYARFK